MLETRKLLGNTKSKINKDKMVNVTHLETTEVVLVHCNIINNDYQHDKRDLCTFVPNKSFDRVLDTSPIYFIFQKPLI